MYLICGFAALDWLLNKYIVNIAEKFQRVKNGRCPPRHYNMLSLQSGRDSGVLQFVDFSNAFGAEVE
jgi:hypothetical protein